MADFTPLTWDEAYGIAQSRGPAPPPAAAPRGALSEIGTGFKSGLVSGLPEMLAKGGQYFTDAGSPTDDLLKQYEQEAVARGQQPEYSLQPDQHGAVVNALASGAQMIPQSLAVPLVAGGALAAARVPAPIRNQGAMIAGAAAPALAQYVDSFRSAKAAGLDDQTAHDVATKTAMIEGGGEYLGERFLGPALGVGKTMLGKMLKPAAQDAGFLRGSVLPYLGSTAETAIGETATEMGQNYGEAKVEQAAGIPGHDPEAEALQAVGPTLGMTGIIAALGLPGYAMAQRQRQQQPQPSAAAVAPSAAAMPATPSPQPAAPPAPAETPEQRFERLAALGQRGQMTPEDYAAAGIPMPPPPGAAPTAPPVAGQIDTTPYDRRTAEGVVRQKQMAGEPAQLLPHPDVPGKFMVAPPQTSMLPAGYFEAQPPGELATPQAPAQTGAPGISDAELANASAFTGDSLASGRRMLLPEAQQQAPGWTAPRDWRLPPQSLGDVPAEPGLGDLRQPGPQPFEIPQPGMGALPAPGQESRVRTGAGGPIPMGAEPPRARRAGMEGQAPGGPPIEGTVLPGPETAPRRPTLSLPKPAVRPALARPEPMRTPEGAMRMPGPTPAETAPRIPDEGQVGQQPGGEPQAATKKFAKPTPVPRVADVQPDAKGFLIEGKPEDVRKAYPKLPKGMAVPGGVRIPASHWSAAKQQEAELHRANATAKAAAPKENKPASEPAQPAEMPALFSKQEKGNAVPVKGSDAGVLRQGRSEVGLPEVGKGNAQEGGATGAQEGSTAKPLDRIKVKRPAVDKTGKRFEIEERADRALEDVDSQIKAIREHLTCLRS